MKTTYSPAENRISKTTDVVNFTNVETATSNREKPGHKPGIVQKKKRKHHATS